MPASSLRKPNLMKEVGSKYSKTKISILFPVKINTD